MSCYYIGNCKKLLCGFYRLNELFNDYGERKLFLGEIKFNVQVNISYNEQILVVHCKNTSIFVCIEKYNYFIDIIG